jgi:anion-transporting  ArsA/GET3 family ATPase
MLSPTFSQALGRTPTDVRPMCGRCAAGVGRCAADVRPMCGYARPAMDVPAFCRESRVLIVAGKGGVGKTTICAALARTAAESGLSVLMVELEGKEALARAFGEGGALEYDATTLLDESESNGPVRARRITPDDALLEYLADHGMRRFSKRLVSSGALDVVATAIPGIRDILVLGKVKQLEREDQADLILLDAPATGHVMTFLSSASGLLDAARSGPLRAQAADVVELLTDPERCRVALVTLPEEMPVNEVVEAAYKLEDRVGVTLGPLIVNACLVDQPDLREDPFAAASLAGTEIDPDLAAAIGSAATFTTRRFDQQEEQLARLADELPLYELRVPYVRGEEIGPEELAVISEALRSGIEALRGHRSDLSGSLGGERGGRRASSGAEGDW